MLEVNGLPTMNDEQRIAGNSIERFDTAIEQNRQAAKLAQVKARFRIVLEKRRENKNRARGDDEPSKNRATFFHAFRFLMKRKRCIEN